MIQGIPVKSSNTHVRVVEELFFLKETNRKFASKLWKLVVKYSTIDKHQSPEERGAVGQSRIITKANLNILCNKYKEYLSKNPKTF